MNHLPSYPRRFRKAFPSATRLTAIVALTLSTATLSACGGISAVTKERVANSSVAVQQTEQTLGRSEEGMVELQRAKENLAAAETAVTRTDEKAAQRYASQAQLHAELAVAQSQSAAARRAADEVLKSTNVLRTETERNTTPMPITPSPRTQLR